MGFYRKPLEDTVPSYVEIIYNSPDLYYINATESVGSSILVKNSNGQLNYIPKEHFALTSSNVFNGDQTINGNLNIIGDITAQQFLVTTSSITHYTASTNFGLDDGDTHTFTGSVKITGSLDVIGSTTTLGNTIISGGIYVDGGINGQINATNGVISSSAQITTFGFVSGSYETTGRGIISSSANLVTTASFNSYTASQSTSSLVDRLNVIESVSGSWITESETGSFATTGSNNFVGEIIITGSLLVSGSGTLRNIGSLITTGSFLVSGSTTQIGNTNLTGNNTISGSNKIFGNTIMSGSLEISGSQTRYGVTRNIGQWELTGSMYTSGSTYIVGNTIIGGNLDLTGSIRVSGSFTGSIQIDGDLNLASPHSFYRWGNKLFNYGNFYNTGSQSGSADTAYSVLLNTTDIAEGFSIVSGSRITATHTGVYNLQFSSQLYANDDAKTQFSFWLAYTGSNVANTQSEVTIPKEPNPGGSSIIALNLMTRMTAGDYVELMYSKTTTLGSIKYIAPGTGPTRPAAPSTIVTMTQVS
jgi:hypothetical protein